MSKRKLVAVAAVLSLLCGSAAAVVAVCLVEASWAPFHAEMLEHVEEALERERAEHQAELARIQRETDAAVTAVAEDPQFATSEHTLLNDLIAEEAARFSAVAAVEQEQAALAAVISERDSLEQRVEQLQAEESNRITDAKRRQSESELPVVMTNAVGMKLKLIAAGDFLMGSATRANGEEQPVHKVTISQPFYLGIYEVTEADWSRVMGGGKGGSRRPATDVSWNDAQTFCEKLSALPKEHAAGRVYRLPTEAEWEYACRAGTTTAYSFGDDESLLGDFAWYSGNSRVYTLRYSRHGKHPVRQKKPNPWGFYDMHGNVWEWCSDLRGDVTVCRGGCWSGGSCRSADRFRSPPSLRSGSVGFRVALSPSGE